MVQRSRKKFITTNGTLLTTANSFTGAQPDLYLSLLCLDRQECLSYCTGSVDMHLSRLPPSEVDLKLK